MQFAADTLTTWSKINWTLWPRCQKSRKRVKIAPLPWSQNQTNIGPKFLTSKLVVSNCRSRVCNQMMKIELNHPKMAPACLELIVRLELWVLLSCRSLAKNNHIKKCKSSPRVPKTKNKNRVLRSSPFSALVDPLVNNRNRFNRLKKVSAPLTKI